MGLEVEIKGIPISCLLQVNFASLRGQYRGQRPLKFSLHLSFSFCLTLCLRLSWRPPVSLSSTLFPIFQFKTLGGRNLLAHLGSDVQSDAQLAAVLYDATSFLSPPTHGIGHRWVDLMSRSPARCEGAGGHSCQCDPRHGPGWGIVPSPFHSMSSFREPTRCHALIWTLLGLESMKFQPFPAPWNSYRTVKTQEALTDFLQQFQLFLC